MRQEELAQQLRDFAEANKFDGKGPLSVALHLTRLAKENGLPLDPDELRTEKEGQVAGLGGGRIKKILADHEIHRPLASEGGRTSRGSLKNMELYVGFLNDRADALTSDNLDFVESWWIDRVRDFFARHPLRLSLDAAQSVSEAFRGLFDEARQRQEEQPGTQVVGAVMQHLVGAKLELVLKAELEHHGAAVADQPSGRNADYEVEDTAVHVTTAPMEALIAKCRQNLAAGKRPIIVTTEERVEVARALAQQAGLGDRIDVLGVIQFLAGNVYELGRFALDGRRETVRRLVDVYNKIVAQCETDPGLRIDLR